MNKFYLLFVLITLPLFNSCEKADKSINSSKSSIPKKINITGAQSIIKTSSTQSLTKSQESSFYITYAEGDPQPLTFTDNTGEIQDLREIYNLIIGDITEIEDNLLQIDAYYTNAETQQESDLRGFFVEKTTGALYPIYNYNYTHVTSGKKGVIYGSSYYNILKIDFSDLNNVTVEPILKETGITLNKFYVNNMGSVIYRDNNNNMKIQLPNGSVRFLKDIVPDFTYYDNIFVLENRFFTPYCEIETLENGEIIVTPFTEKIFISESEPIKNEVRNTLIVSGYHIPSENGVSYDMLVEYDLTNNKFITTEIFDHDLYDISKWKYRSSEYMYSETRNANNQKTIKKADLREYNTSIWDLSGQSLDVKSISIIPSSAIIHFTAFRMTDAKNVYGTADSQGNIISIDEAIDNRQTEILVRLN